MPARGRGRVWRVGVAAGPSGVRPVPAGGAGGGREGGLGAEGRSRSGCQCAAGLSLLSDARTEGCLRVGGVSDRGRRACGGPGAVSRGPWAGSGGESCAGTTHVGRGERAGRAAFKPRSRGAPRRASGQAGSRGTAERQPERSKRGFRETGEPQNISRLEGNLKSTRAPFSHRTRKSL